jgi:hypothetical protein
MKLYESRIYSMRANSIDVRDYPEIADHVILVRWAQASTGSTSQCRSPIKCYTTQKRMTVSTLFDERDSLSPEQNLPKLQDL